LWRGYALKIPPKLPFNDRNWMLVSKRVLNLNQRRRILELGSGRGDHLNYFAKMGHECTGIDLNKDSVRRAHAVYGKLCSFVVADGCCMPFKNECFDTIYSNETLSHVVDLAGVLSEQIRSLKREGELMVRDGNFLFPLSLMELLIFYPVRTGGKYGGLKWVFNYDKVLSNIYGTGYRGKDESIRTLNWWRSALMNYPDLILKVATTSYVVAHPNWLTRLLAQLIGQVVVVAKKVGI
jgi:SAM-dependent methyltransferase